MDESRRRMVFGGAVGAVALTLDACGGGGSYGSSTTMTPLPMTATTSAPAASSPEALSCGAASIGGNHGHVLSIPQADLSSTVNMTYNIEGSADHNHTVTLTPEQLQQIKAKNSVTVVSTVGGSADFPAHSHPVTLTCM
ncbi:MAG TPA: hypothetical protein VN680_11225 [Burkholderiaceae bacterium]|nr:hypothetical protein [Burkholderiaceae bacterium]